jgi:hypothetical protein
VIRESLVTATVDAPLTEKAMSTPEPLSQESESSAMTGVEQGRRTRGPRAVQTNEAYAVPAFWAVAFAFLIVVAFATLPSPLYGLCTGRGTTFRP